MSINSSANPNTFTFLVELPTARFGKAIERDQFSGFISIGKVTYKWENNDLHVFGIDATSPPPNYYSTSFYHTNLINLHLGFDHAPRIILDGIPFNRVQLSPGTVFFVKQPAEPDWISEDGHSVRAAYKTIPTNPSHSTWTLQDMIAHIARVSSQQDERPGDSSERLCRYLLAHGHFSPYEHMSLTLEVKTTRAIFRQLLRHRSMTFQEYSQRYEEVSDFMITKARMQASKNRQSSVDTATVEVSDWWEGEQEKLLVRTKALYHEALQKGIAREVARAILPEGLTMTRGYVTGNIRSWIHYIEARTAPDAQSEHRTIAHLAAQAVCLYCPMIVQYDKVRDECKKIED